jgi:hypothetical protein
MAVGIASAHSAAAINLCSARKEIMSPPPCRNVLIEPWRAGFARIIRSSGAPITSAAKAYERSDEQGQDAVASVGSADSGQIRASKPVAPDR